MRLAKAMLLLAVAGSVSPAVAHHPGGKSGPAVLIDRTQHRYRVVLQVSPGEPTAGSPTEFVLWVLPEGHSYAYGGEIRLWVHPIFQPPASPKMVSIAQWRTTGGAYRAEHRFERAGIYRVEVDLASLLARWDGYLEVDPPTPWYLWVGNPMVFGGLVVALMLFLHWWSRRAETRS